MIRWPSVVRYVLGCAAFDAALYLTIWLWDRKRRPNAQNADLPVIPAAKDQHDDIIYDTIFFPESTLPCRFHYRNADCQRHDCPYTHEAALLDRLLNTFKNATTTLDVCVYIITCTELQNAILNVHRRGVQVRLITDGNATDDTATRIKKFRSLGISVRTSPAGFMMHHKYILVDGKLLVNGSFNWTWGAITGNRENIFITNNKRLVEPFVNEFNKLWNLYEPELVRQQNVTEAAEKALKSS